MFALPIAGLRGARRAAPLWLKLAAVSGFLMTALYVILSVFPIVPVGKPACSRLKITLVVVATNAAGAMLFVVARRRQRTTRMPAVELELRQQETSGV